MHNIISNAVALFAAMLPFTAAAQWQAALSLGMRLEWIKVPRSGEVTAYRHGQPMGTLAQPEHGRHAATLFARYLF